MTSRDAERRGAGGRTRRWRRLRPLARQVARGLAAVAVAASLGLVWLWSTTDIDRARFVRPRDSLTVTDRHGDALRHRRPDGHDRRWVQLADISPHLIDAVLAVEDSRFRKHAGVDVRATARAAFSFALPGRRLSGGSTITQQLVKLVYGRPSGLLSKPREVVRALMLERRFDKDWILEQYLNRLPFGDQIIGVERAAEVYFGRPASDLTVAQAALLAGIPQAPSALNPRRHRGAAIRRQHIVLARMSATGRLSSAQRRRARAEPVVIERRPVRPWRAPRAAEAALREESRGGIQASAGVLRTTLDLPLTDRAREILAAAVQRHHGRGVENAAAVVLDNRSGAVLAYVGAALQGGEEEGGWLDLARARRQPGSTLKPFVYELLFEDGSTAATVLDDLHRGMVGANGTLFTARNYDGRERGPVLARRALSASLNLAALDAARRVGAPRIVSRLQALGVPLDPAARYGAAIVLGGADVSVIELAQAYATLANGGHRVTATFFPSDDGLGDRVLRSGPAAITTDILSDRAARRAAFGDDLSELYDSPFALKTGTSSAWRDSWTAASTAEVTVVVWLGSPAGRPLLGLSGFEGAARPAVRILAAVHERRGALGIDETASASAEAPRLSRAQVCADTGLRPGPACSHTLDERFLPGTTPHQRCEAHGPDGRVLLPSRYAGWLARAHPAGFTRAEVSDGGAGQVAIVYPESAARLLLLPGQAIPLRATVNGERTNAEWEIDGRPLRSELWTAAPGDHVLVAVVHHRRSPPVTAHVERAL